MVEVIIGYVMLVAIILIASPLLIFWFIATRDIRKSKDLYAKNKIENRIYARQCVLKTIEDKKIVKDFLYKNHLFGLFINLFMLYKFNKHIIYGLYKDNKLVYVVCFKKYNKNDDYECYAMCSLTYTLVIGAVSKVFKTFILTNPNSNIKTWSIGNKQNIYEKMGFERIRKGFVYSVLFRKNTVEEDSKGLFTLWRLRSQNMEK